MGRINRRIYATRRKRASALKFMGSRDSWNKMQESVNEGVYGSGFGGAIRSMKYMVDNAKPPYLNETGGDELGIGGGKTYTITEV